MKFWGTHGETKHERNDKEITHVGLRAILCA